MHKIQIWILILSIYFHIEEFFKRKKKNLATAKRAAKCVLI